MIVILAILVAGIFNWAVHRLSNKDTEEVINDENNVTLI